MAVMRAPENLPDLKTAWLWAQALLSAKVVLFLDCLFKIERAGASNISN
jgi:hypothetical protein